MILDKLHWSDVSWWVQAPLVPKRRNYVSGTWDIYVYIYINIYVYILMMNLQVVIYTAKHDCNISNCYCMSQCWCVISCRCHYNCHHYHATQTADQNCQPEVSWCWISEYDCQGSSWYTSSGWIHSSIYASWGVCWCFCAWSGEAQLEGLIFSCGRGWEPLCHKLVILSLWLELRPYPSCRFALVFVCEESFSV